MGITASYKRITPHKFAEIQNAAKEGDIVLLSSN
jgi:hypothetical protein